MDKALENYITDKLIDIQNQLDNFDRRLRAIEDKTPNITHTTTIPPTDISIEEFGKELDQVLEDCKNL